MLSTTPPAPALTPTTSPQPRYRSAAVARIAGMPVATLRIWEQRYRAIGPTTTRSGHRLYSGADVERVVLLRQLTESGHAIGTLAALSTEALRPMAATHAAVQAHSSAPRGDTALTVVVVGQTMAQRLRRLAALGGAQQPPSVVAVFESINDAVQAASTPAGSAGPIDLLLWQTAGVQGDDLRALRAAQAIWAPRLVAVAYRFAGVAARKALVQAGAERVREPSDDAALAAWLAELQGRLASVDPDAADTTATSAWAHRPEVPGAGAGAPPPRRFDDAALAGFAGLSSTIACECPQHLAELLLQITGFESYAAECANRSPQDAALHTYLHQVTTTARVLFESALERVAVAEGLPLP